MATVNLTPNLKRDIIHNIRSSYLERAMIPIGALIEMDLGTEAYQLAFKEDGILLAQQLTDISTEKWVTLATNVIVEITYPSIMKEDTVFRKTIYYELPNPVVVPTNKLRDGSASGIRLELPTYAPSYETAIKLFRECEAIEEECHQTVKSIKHDILDKCTTLEQLLEVWPDAMEFIPGYAKDGHNLKITAGS